MIISFGVVVFDDYFYVFSGYDGGEYGFGVDVLVDYFCCIDFSDLGVEW